MPLAATLALTASVAVAAFGVLAPLIHWIVPATELPAPFPEQHQDAETLGFLLVFAVLLPISLVAGPRLAIRVARRAGAESLSSIAALLTLALVALLVGVKVSERLPWGGGLGTLLVAAVAWTVLAAAVLGAAAPARLDPPRSLSGRAPAIWRASAVLGLVLVVCFAFTASIDLVPLLIAAALAALLLAGAGGNLPELGGRRAAAADALVCLLLVLVTVNLAIFGFAEPPSADDTILQFHQNFFLGPANGVLGGEPILVDTLSQYGVGSILFLAGIFEVVPIGNPMVGVVEGLLAAATMIAGYAVLRLCSVSRGLAALAMAFAAVVLVLAAQFPIGGLLQHGAIRFGLPIGVVLGAVLEARHPARAPAGRALALITIAIASIWALEAFAYTLLTTAAVLAFAAWDVAPGERARWLGPRLAAVAAACVLAHLAFAAVTLLAAGELPDWGPYLDTLRAFLTGGVGDLTFDFSPWSPAFAIGGLYLVSAAAIVLTTRLRPDDARRERVALLALSGLTAYGIALLSYYVNRSGDHIVAFIALPALLLWVLWLAVILRSDAAGPAIARAARLGTAALAVLLVSIAWSATSARLPETALAHLVPGGEPLGPALDRLVDPPGIAAGAEEAEHLLEGEMAGERSSIVLTSADLSVEALMRTGRVNRLPLANPWEDSLVPDAHLPALREAIADLEPGDRVLLDGAAIEVFEGFRREPDRDPLAEPFSRATLVPTGIAILQEWVLDEVGERFRLDPVVTGSDGLVVAELAPRSITLPQGSFSSVSVETAGGLHFERPVSVSFFGDPGGKNFVGWKGDCNAASSGVRIDAGRLLTNGQGVETLIKCDEARASRDRWLRRFFREDPLIIRDERELVLTGGIGSITLEKWSE